jgi:5-methyltetrahydrofolate--homocysteine methyltransferase
MNENGQGPRHRRPRPVQGTRPADAGDGGDGNGTSSTDPIAAPTIEATSANARWRALLAEGGPILADGAMGTMLFAAGLQFGDPPEAWNVMHPDVVRRIQRGYVEAGSRIILTNTFGGNRLRLRLHGLDKRVDELNRTAAILLRAEVDAAGGHALVAGDIGPSGEIMAPLGTLEEDEAVDVFAEQAAALVAGGVDLIWIETMSHLSEITAAIRSSIPPA